MKKIVVEVGSTCTKIDAYDGKKIKRLDSVTIQFKKNYSKGNKLDENDVEQLIKRVNELKEISSDIYVCGTSIFRSLDEEQRKQFLEYFKQETNLDFHIISQEKENELTVLGIVKNINQRVAIFIGGGGSTEIAIYDNGIKEMVNSKVGVIDVMNKFPDLGGDLAITELDIVRNYIKERLNFPKQKADILILAGGGHERFARGSGITYEKNTLFDDESQPIMMNIENRIRDTQRYYKEISLDNVRNNDKDPGWWHATRAMSAFVLDVAEEIEAKYIVPTDISMVYGILNNID